MPDPSLRNKNYFDVPESLDCHRCDGWGAIWNHHYSEKDGKMAVYRTLDEDPCTECLGNGLDHIPLTEFYRNFYYTALSEIR